MSRILHQAVVAAVPGDAITTHALTLRSWLRDLGFVSNLYAWHIHEEMVGDVRPLALYRPGRQESCLIYHHSIGSPAVEHVCHLPLKLLLIYHNITPSGFFASADPVWTALLEQGRAQIATLRPHTFLGLAVSAYNAAELQAAGYSTTGVLPLILDASRYQLPQNTALAQELVGDGPLLLFVGRFAPNKRQEDLVKLLYCLRRIRPGARLALVGDHWLPDYTAFLMDMIRRLDLLAAVLCPGRVTQQDLVTYYHCADLFVSMSEHEGFCMPLIESMIMELPILAYAATAVPGTLEHTGIQFHQKDFRTLAELVDLVMADQELRQRLVTRQRQQVQAFLAPQVRQTFVHHLCQAGLLTE